MSALAQNKVSQAQSESVTTISAAARVDYILRFSKQAIMVIDDDISLCSDKIGHFVRQGNQLFKFL